MLYAAAVERTYDSSLNQAPVPINSSRMDLTANPLLLAVIDYCVLQAIRHPLVQLRFISVNGGLYFNVLLQS